MILGPKQARAHHAGLVLILACLMASAGRAQCPGWTALYNGKDLTGWEHVGPAQLTRLGKSGDNR